MNKIIVSFIFATLLMGCSSVELKQHKLQFNEIVVKNASFSDIEDLEIRVSNVNKVFSCGLVLAKSFCSNKFKIRGYEGNSIMLGWKEKDKKIVKGPLVIDPPISKKEEIYSIILTLDSNGIYMVSFKLQ